MTKQTAYQLNPSIIAQQYIDIVNRQTTSITKPINVVGLIASQDKPSFAYARATQKKFEANGIHYQLRNVERLELENQILSLNSDSDVHGIFIYFPVFNNQQDDYLRNLVDFSKDIEAGSNYWTRKLYANDRLALTSDPTKKALLPCTPLAIVKMLSEIDIYNKDIQRPIEGKIVTIFNRSEVIGRPLAMMMSNDGGIVYSFDENGPLKFENAQPSEIDISRAEALSQSSIIITGVPNKNFKKISAAEIQPDTICINFSSSNNFAADISAHTHFYIPRIGPMTVAMCMRNTLRLFNIFHQAT